MAIVQNERFMKQFIITLLIVSTVNLANSQNGKLPIIDMHLHINNTIYSKVRPCYPEPCDKSQTAIKEISELLPKTIEMMDKHNVVLGFVSSRSLNDLYKWKEAYPERFIISPSINHPELFQLDMLRKEYQKGRLQGMGELNTIYNGIPPNSPEMEPIYDLAEEFRNAGPLRPRLDVDHLLMARAPSGVYHVIAGDVIELDMPAILLAA